MRRTGGDKGHVLPQLVDSSIHELERLREHFDVGRLQAATELVLAANAVHLLAQRRAYPVAGYLAYGLAQLEIRAFLLDSVGGMLRQQVGAIGAGDVLLAASFRNYTAEVVEAAELASARGAVVIAITEITPSRRWRGWPRSPWRSATIRRSSSARWSRRCAPHRRWSCRWAMHWPSGNGRKSAAKKAARRT